VRLADLGEFASVCERSNTVKEGRADASVFLSRELTGVKVRGGDLIV
jgi:hypothetical protein